MRSLSNLGIGLSLVFGCLLLALLAELYYVLWWKKRLNREIWDEYSSSAKDLLYLFCWKKPASLSSAALNPREVCGTTRNSGAQNQHEQDQHQQSASSKDFLLKPLGEEGLESEIMRLHDLSGLPRFLFTIKEETKEDMESEDGKTRCGRSRKGGSRTRSLSDLLLAVETPYGTPLSSSPFLTPPLTPMDYQHANFSFSNGFNPLFEVEGESHMVRSSPPPKFKFLRDAEEKLSRRLTEAQMAQKRHEIVKEEKMNNPSSLCDPCVKIGGNEEGGSFITIIINKNAENQHLPQVPSDSALVLPLQSSPSENKKSGLQNTQISSHPKNEN